MKRACALLPAWLVLGFFLAGCSSYEAQVAPQRRPAAVKRYFVLTNLNDNHGLAEQIAAALQLRSREASIGPLTMMPDDTQALVSYEDHWTWDFGDHLVFLQIAVRDLKSNQPYTTVRFSATIPTTKSTAGIIGQLVDRMLAGD